jgi:hypothetical protein
LHFSSKSPLKANKNRLKVDFSVLTISIVIVEIRAAARLASIGKGVKPDFERKVGENVRL